MKKTDVVKRGDVWWCDFSGGVGSEQSDLRPSIVVSNSMCNTHSNVVTVVPLTTATKTRLPCHVKLYKGDCDGLEKPSTALCEQVRTVDKERIKDRVGYVKSRSMKCINEALATQLSLTVD